MSQLEEIPLGVDVSTEPEEGGSGGYVHADGEPSDDEVAESLWMALQRRLS